MFEMLLLVVLLFYCDYGEGLEEGYVYGGSYPKLQMFPHSAFISVSCQRYEADTTRKEWVCGASIVHELGLLTAAHCMTGCTSSVIVGAIGNYMDRRFTHPARDAHTHRAYDAATFANDVAVIELSGPIVFNDVIKPAVLKPQLRFRVVEAYLAGWGFVNLTERRAGTELKQTRLEVWTRALCSELLGELPAAVFCAGNDYVDHHAATESGSPLVTHSEEGDIEIGMVSYQMPQVSRAVHLFTFLPMYHDWIQDRLKRIHGELPAGVKAARMLQLPLIKHRF